MSKERELLQYILNSHAANGSKLDKFWKAKIEELLAQPEQSNEPVAWRGVNFTEAEGDWLYRDIDEPFTDSNYRNVGEALYLAPQKREPLSDEHLGDLVDYCSGYPMALGRAVEMAHDINGIDDLPDADCENCNYFIASYTEYSDQWCYMFKERPGDKCGQFKTVAGVDNEPVAWMYDWKTPTGEVQNVFRSKNHLTTDLGYVLNEVENVRPLYLAPPKQHNIGE